MTLNAVERYVITSQLTNWWRFVVDDPEKESERERGKERGNSCSIIRRRVNGLDLFLNSINIASHKVIAVSPRSGLNQIYYVRINYITNKIIRFKQMLTQRHAYMSISIFYIYTSGSIWSNESEALA